MSGMANLLRGCSDWLGGPDRGCAGLPCVGRGAGKMCGNSSSGDVVSLALRESSHMRFLFLAWLAVRGRGPP